MITLPAGEFLMGAPKGQVSGGYFMERPRRVTVPLPFAMGRTAVTFAMWDAALEAGLSRFFADYPLADEGWGRDDRPLINVSWNYAQAYCTWLNQRLGLAPGTYRLPSEAEWEYACRAGTTTPFSFGKTISTEQANYDGSLTYGKGRKGEYRERTVPVGSLPANPWGLHEMHGNVWEWVEDTYGPYPGQATDASPLVEAEPHEDERVLRGGSWLSEPRDLNSGGRYSHHKWVRDSTYGFRVARTLG
ncbi:MAG: formylglycine-generating enzyme family protein [Roseomonas sp.]|nr:formylglycine-generating enzyme family protein [Roseomonas sp.]